MPHIPIFLHNAPLLILSPPPHRLYECLSPFYLFEPVYFTIFFQSQNLWYFASPHFLAVMTLVGISPRTHFDPCLSRSSRSLILNINFVKLNKACEADMHSAYGTLCSVKWEGPEKISVQLIRAQHVQVRLVLKEDRNWYRQRYQFLLSLVFFGGRALLEGHFCLSTAALKYSSGQSKNWHSFNGAHSFGRFEKHALRARGFFPEARACSSKCGVGRFIKFWWCPC